VIVNHAFGGPLPSGRQLAGWKALPAEFLGVFLLIGIGEEAGWTAFAAPRLIATHPFARAWLLLGGLRVLWHLPLMLSGDLPWTLGVGGNLAFQFVLLSLFRRSGGAWVPAALWHTMLNATGGAFFFQMVEGADRERLGVLFTAAYVTVAVVLASVESRRATSSAGATPPARPGTRRRHLAAGGSSTTDRS
jgi:membrane protease YdiL (CAAX protease family)